MGKFCILTFGLALAVCARASWYWPFGSDDTGDSPEPPRLSVLMEPASLLIDEASDLAGDGKVDESVAKYRQALVELDRIERENPERAKTSEFATIRNKRAYVNAAIDAMLLSQVRENAKAVAVSDTTELEKRLAEERSGKKSPVKPAVKGQGEVTNAAPAQLSKPSKPSKLSKPLTKREQAMVDIANGDYAAADILIQEMLTAKPNNPLALNLKATSEARQGKLKEAEQTLDQAIMSNPRSHFAYYNMAIVILQRNPDNKAAAKRYYETGRTYGGPKDEQLEALFR